MKTKKICVGLSGIAPIMFDRYPGDNQTILPPEKKFYFGNDGKSLVFPSANLMSFLTAENTKSAPKVLFESKEYKKICMANAAFVAISPFEIPLTADGKQIVFEGWNDKIHVLSNVARVKGIPHPLERPYVDIPWELEFTIYYTENKTVSERMLQDIFVQGGIRVGLGTFRPIYGKFVVTKWEEIE